MPAIDGLTPTVSLCDGEASVLAGKIDGEAAVASAGVVGIADGTPDVLMVLRTPLGQHGQTDSCKAVALTCVARALAVKRGGTDGRRGVEACS